MRRSRYSAILVALTLTLASVLRSVSTASSAPARHLPGATASAPILTLTVGVVRPGTNLHLVGHRFVPHSVVRVSLTIARTDASNDTFIRNAAADARGDFSMFLLLPSDTRLGKYRIDAVDRTGNARAAAYVTVSIHPSIKVVPTAALPGQSVTVSGANFASNAQISVLAAFAIRGGIRRYSVVTHSGSAGNYSTRLTVPSNALPGYYRITARSSTGEISAFLQVRRGLIRPTAVPTATRTSPGTTPVPVPTPVKKHRHRKFGFRYISIWYHTVRVGTSNHLVVQAKRRTTQGLWVHVWFPSGQTLTYFENTSRHGHWERDIPIPADAIANGNAHVLVTFRLWHGKKSRERFSGFMLAP